jgi:2-methylisocitrate lyase-like PEP mutase family enzyme
VDGASSGELIEVQTQVRKIQTIRRVGDEMGVPLVINARTDVYLAGIGEPAGRFNLAVERLRAYIDAGADCLFVPGISDESLIRDFVEALRFPLNILIGPGMPPLRRLRELGVTRVSTGSSVARATIGLTRRIAREIKETGALDSLLEGAISYADANALFQK